MDIAETLKALADPNRLRILTLLGDQTLCVCDLESALGLEQSNLSRHLSRLKQAGLVTSSKRAQFVYYTRTRIAEPYGTAVNELYRALATDPAWTGKGCSAETVPCCE